MDIGNRCAGAVCLGGRADDYRNTKHADHADYHQLADVVNDIEGYTLFLLLAKENIDNNISCGNIFKKADVKILLICHYGAATPINSVYN